MGSNLKVLGILKPARYREEIQDPKTIKKKYKYWRLRTFYGMYTGYAFYYFTRKSFTFAAPALADDLGFDKIKLGILGSILSISYGVSKFISGIVGDRSNPRYFMAIGLILTGLFNLFFGMSSTLMFFAIFWGLNGWFQGWGWPPCAKLLTHWYSHSERGRWWSLWNTSHNLGGTLIPILVAFCAEHFGWRYAMYVPGIFSIIIGFFLINRLRDTPQSLGLPPIEKYKNDYVDKGKKIKEKTKFSTKELLFDYVLRNHFIWILAISYFFIYTIRTAANDWSVLFLVDAKGYSLLKAGFCVCWFDVGGFFGSLAAGWFSDEIFDGKRNPVNILFTVAVIVTIVAMWQLIPYSHPMVDCLMMFLVGFFIFGPQMLIGIAAAELSHKKAAGTATGFTGCFAYLGAATAGGPLGALIKTWGWEVFFVVLTASGIVGLLLMLPLWSVKTNPLHREPQ